MAKNRNTFAKHQRDVEKRAKAEAKRERRNDRRLARKAGNVEQPEANAASAVDLTKRMRPSTNEGRGAMEFAPAIHRPAGNSV